MGVSGISHERRQGTAVVVFVVVHHNIINGLQVDFVSDWPRILSSKGFQTVSSAPSSDLPDQIGIVGRAFFRRIFMAMELRQFPVDFPNPGDFILRNFFSHMKTSPLARVCFSMVQVYMEYREKSVVSTTNKEQRTPWYLWLIWGTIQIMLVHLPVSNFLQLKGGISMKIKRVLAIHDLCSFGRCSLTAAMPVLSAMGHQVCRSYGSKQQQPDLREIRFPGSDGPDGRVPTSGSAWALLMQSTAVWQGLPRWNR